MIIELIKYLTNPNPKYIKALGYLKESIAIEGRYNRNKYNWENHLENTKQFITDTVNNLSQKRKVVILGSGSLYDVPIDLLSNSFQKVICVDIVHLRNVKRKFKKYSNVIFLQKDITGIAEKLYNNFNTMNNTLPSPRHDFSFIEKDVDLVISLNILSQLPLNLKSFAEQNFNFSEEQILNFCNSIIKSHYQFLKRLSCEICLIAETKREFIDKKSNIIKSNDALFGFKLEESKTTWDWELAPTGEYSSKYSIENKIFAYNKGF
ncbi:MAG: hypothetical protein JEY94_13310 [Melioribacteraceae bacterium]|nr:hypothetical protein [Melioribacteraceae bacterium]